MKDHAKTKGMWAGALVPVATADLLGLYTDPPALRELARPQTPALLKSIDEIIVNAVDQAASKGSKTTYIRVGLSAAGEVSVANDGAGIPVAVHAAASAAAGRPVYVPEVAFAYFLAGTNINKAADCVKGGTNGLGAKLANVHSAEFRVETVDRASRLRYSQRFSGGLDVTHPPEVGAAADWRAPYVPGT